MLLRFDFVQSFFTSCSLRMHFNFLRRRKKKATKNKEQQAADQSRAKSSKKRGAQARRVVSGESENGETERKITNLQSTVVALSPGGQE